MGCKPPDMNFLYHNQECTDDAPKEIGIPEPWRGVWMQQLQAGLVSDKARLLSCSC